MQVGSICCGLCRASAAMEETIPGHCVVQLTEAFTCKMPETSSGEIVSRRSTRGAAVVPCGTVNANEVATTEKGSGWVPPVHDHGRGMGLADKLRVAYDTRHDSGIGDLEDGAGARISFKTREDRGEGEWPATFVFSCGCSFD